MVQARNQTTAPMHSIDGRWVGHPPMCQVGGEAPPTPAHQFVCDLYESRIEVWQPRKIKKLTIVA